MSNDLAAAIDALEVHNHGLAAALRLLYQRRYSGSVILHWHDGIPRLIELPRTKIRLTPAPPPTSS